jgi:hypothetical protein
MKHNPMSVSRVSTEPAAQTAQPRPPSELRLVLPPPHHRPILKAEHKPDGFVGVMYLKEMVARDLRNGGAAIVLFKRDGGEPDWVVVTRRAAEKLAELEPEALIHFVRDLGHIGDPSESLMLRTWEHGGLGPATGGDATTDTTPGDTKESTGDSDSEAPPVEDGVSVTGEDCGNRRDDNNDGLRDCEDPSCLAVCDLDGDAARGHGLRRRDRRRRRRDS